MDLTWNLDTLYTSFDSPKFKGDMELLDQKIERINNWVNDNLKDTERAADKLEEFLRLYNEYKSIYSCLLCYGWLVFNGDNTNEEAMDAMDIVEDKESMVIESFVMFNQWLNYIEDIHEVVRTSEYLEEHRFYIEEILRKSKYLLDDKGEMLINKMQNTGARAWQRMFMESYSTQIVQLEINGEIEKVSLADIRDMAYDKNQSLREAAYNAEAKGCEGISKIAAACLNGISGEALTVYDLKGYKSPLEKVLLESRMDRETFDAMFTSIKENLHIFHGYYKKKGAILGHRGKLPFHDIFAPITDGEADISFEQARDIIVSGFTSFSKELGDFASRLFKERWIDAEPRAGKGNFGLCVDIFPIKESRILTNFTGKYNDVLVMAHEIGHAYHSYCLRAEEMLNTDYPTPIAETASIFCETIINETSGSSERSIADAGYYIVDFYGRYLFENKLYERRKSGQLSVEELSKLMKECMLEAYGDSIESDTIHPYMWMNKMGYFMAGNEYLNFPYSFGVLFAKGLYSQYLKNGQEFVVKYDELLRVTSRNDIVDIAKKIGVDIHSVEFWNRAFEVIEDSIKKL